MLPGNVGVKPVKRTASALPFENWWPVILAWLTAPPVPCRRHGVPSGLMSGLPIIACPECDLLQRPVAAAPGRTVRCGRCGAPLYRLPAEGSIERAVALLIAALILFAVGQSFPVLEMRLQDHLSRATTLAGVQLLYGEGYQPVALLVLLTTVVAPLVQILGMLAVLLPFRLGRHPSYLRRALRIVETVAPWSMISVFLLGVLVALVKLGDLARIIPGVSLWAFAVMVVLLASATTAVDAHALWARLEQRR